MKVTKTNPMELKPGDIVREHGAMFRVIESIRYTPDSGHYQANICEWISGVIIPGYFGPTKNWNVQGNENAVTYLINEDES